MITWICASRKQEISLYWDFFRWSRQNSEYHFPRQLHYNQESLAFMSTEVQRILKHGSNRRAAITLKGQDPQMTHRSKASQKALYFLTSEANTNIGFALNVASFSGSIVSEPWKYEVI